MNRLANIYIFHPYNNRAFFFLNNFCGGVLALRLNNILTSNLLSYALHKLGIWPRKKSSCKSMGDTAKNKKRLKISSGSGAWGVLHTKNDKYCIYNSLSLKQIFIYICGFIKAWVKLSKTQKT